MLNLSIDELYRQEVELYTHRVSSGNLTPLIYDMLKDTEDVKGLLDYLGYSEEKKEVQNDVPKRKTFTELFKNSVEVI